MTSTEILRHLNRRHRLGGSVSPSSSQSSLSLESAKSNLAQGGIIATIVCLSVSLSIVALSVC